jgi:hypothetical protein
VPVPTAVSLVVPSSSDVMMQPAPSGAAESRKIKF